MRDNDFLTGRLWTKMIFLMGLLTLFGPLVDYASFTQGGFGTVNNLSLVFLLFFPVIFALNLKHLRHPVDRGFLLGSLLVALVVFLRTTFDPDTTIHGIIGSLILVMIVASAFGAYAVALRGVDVTRTLVQMVLLTSLFLPLAPLLVAMSPDAFDLDVYFLNVYGYSNIRVLGYFSGGVTTAFALMWAVALGSGSRPKMALYAALAVISWSVLFWSGSRASLAGVIAAVALVWLLVSRPKWKEVTLSLVTMLAGYALHLTYHLPDRHFGFGTRLERTLNGIAESDMTLLTTNRSDLWAWAIERISEAPLVGHGLYAMSHMRNESFNFFHTHNVILEYLFGLGIPLGGLIVVVMLTLFFKCGKAAKLSGDPYAVACFGLIAFAAGAAQFSAALFFPFYMMVFSMGIAGLMAQKKR